MLIYLPFSCYNSASSPTTHSRTLDSAVQIDNSSGDTSTGSTTINDECASDVVRRSTFLCAETTSPLVAYDFAGVGTITDVGTNLPPIVGSVSPPWMSPCDAATPMARITDDSGDTWTFGWRGPDDPTGALAPGQSISFKLNSATSSLLFSDAGGPLLYEEYPIGNYGLVPTDLHWTTEDRGGVEIDPTFDPYTACWNTERTALFGATDVSWPGGSTEIQSGAELDIPLASPVIMRLVLMDDSVTKVGCEFFCTGWGYLAWRIP